MSITLQINYQICHLSLPIGRLPRIWNPICLRRLAKIQDPSESYASERLRHDISVVPRRGDVPDTHDSLLYAFGGMPKFDVDVLAPAAAGCFTFGQDDASLVVLPEDRARRLRFSELLHQLAQVTDLNYRTAEPHKLALA